MRFLDLGPLAVELDGPSRTLGGRRVEAVAAALLVHVGVPLPAAALVDAVWGADPPAGAGGALDSLIWRLRRVLEPGRAARDAALVRRDEQGYRLAVAPEVIDSHVIAAAATAAGATTDAGDALRIADDALGRWRGTPYDGVPDTGWLEPVRTRLAEVRVTLQQHRLDALLATGQPDRAVADLVPLLVEHPYRESLWERRLRALYASGRQQAALAAFHELRRTLADELGVEPGPRLRRLHEQVLAHDPALQPRADVHVAVARSGPARAVEVHLPRRGTRFVGRDDERRELADRLSASRVVTLTGPGGCGKTRLAVEVAGEARELFPDGVWFVDLSTVTDADPDPADRVAGRVAATLGLDPGPHRTALDALSRFAAERAVLLLLDNCEQVVDGAAAAVEAVVEAAPAATVLATSRQPLGVDGETVRPVEPLALPVSDTLDARAASPAVALFLERVRARGEPAGLDGPDGSAIARICAAVDGLPLGIELAAARVGTFTLTEIADGLGRGPGTLSRLGRGPARQRNLHEEVDWSYRLATPDERIAHRRLAVLPRPFTLDAAEAVCGLPPLRPGSALDLVGGLAHRSLLASTRASRPGGPTWFGQLDTIRAHARGMLRESGEEEAVVAARTRWVVDRVAAAPRYGRPGQAAWFDWLDDNRATIENSLEEALAPGAPGRPPETLPFAVGRLVRYWIDRMHVVTGRRLVRLTAEVTWTDPLAAAAAAAAFGTIQAVDQDMAAARSRLLGALPVLLAAPEERWADAGDLLTGIAAAVWVGDDWPLAARIARGVAEFGARTGDAHVALTARALVSAADLIVGDAQEAMALARAVLVEESGIGDDFAALFAAVTLGIGAGFSGDPAAGLAWTEEILRRQAALGSDDLSDVLEQRGGHLDAVGRPDDAVRTLSASAARQRRVGRTWPRTEGTSERLKQLRTRLGATRFTRAWRAGQHLELAELLAADRPSAQQPGSRAAR